MRFAQTRVSGSRPGAPSVYGTRRRAMRRILLVFGLSATLAAATAPAALAAAAAAQGAPAAVAADSSGPGTMFHG
jgi:hypothetical protein